jgi:chemotaxis protein CheD
MALLTVGIGDLKVSNDPADVLVTHALGSCIAVVIYDPVARIAGLLHFMLPQSSLDSEKAGRLPCLFADTGIPLLLDGVFTLGAAKSRLVVVVTGGAQMLDSCAIFNVGQRNLAAVRDIFDNAGIRIHREEIGGTRSRTVCIDVAGGNVQLRMAGKAGHDLVAAGGIQCRR